MQNKFSITLIENVAKNLHMMKNLVQFIAID